MGMTLEEFDYLSYHEGSPAAIKKYFASYDVSLFEHQKSPRAISKVDVRCNVFHGDNCDTKLRNISVVFTDEDYCQTKIERHTLYLRKHEARELAEALNSIVDADEKLTEYFANIND